MSQPLRIIWDNRRLEAATVTVSSAAAGYPGGNLLDRLRTRIWRSSGLAGEYIGVDFGAAVYCSCLALVDHNFTVDGTLRIQASNLPDFSVLLKDDVYDACEDMLGFGDGGFGGWEFGGVIPYADRPLYAPKTLRILYFNLVEARYWRVLITDAANPTGYFSIGRLFLCTYDDYLYQFEFDWENGGEDETEINLSRGGQSWRDPQPVRRTLRLPWSLFDNADKYWRLQYFVQTVGLSRDFVIDPFPDGQAAERFFTAMLVCLSEIPPLGAVAVGLSRLELNFIEQL